MPRAHRDRPPVGQPVEHLGHSLDLFAPERHVAAPFHRERHVEAQRLDPRDRDVEVWQGRRQGDGDGERRRSRIRAGAEETVGAGGPQGVDQRGRERDEAGDEDEFVVSRRAVSAGRMSTESPSRRRPR
jgi:hypothetical protein